MNPADTGLVGRIMEEMSKLRADSLREIENLRIEANKVQDRTQRQVNTVVRLGIGVLLTLVGVLIALVANLVVGNHLPKP